LAKEESVVREVTELPSGKSYRRGYPVAILIGFDTAKAALWKVYSQVVKPDKTIHIEGTRNDPKAVYTFHESIINALRPAMKEGVKSIIIASPARTNYGTDFQKHIQDHHAWLSKGPGKATFAQMTGSATTMHEITTLSRTAEFLKVIGETTEEESENLVELLEKRLNATGIEPLVLYSFDEIENAIYSPWKPSKPHPEFLILTDNYTSTSHQRNRVQRLLQVAVNRNVKTRIVKADTIAGKRVLQLGGLVCIMIIQQPS
jgi:stalled ribosome rescue protein Dom34